MSISPEPAAKRLPLDEIAAGVIDAERVTTVSPLDRLEEQRIEDARLGNELKRAYIANVNADRKMREHYASRILRYLEMYSACVGVIVIASGISLLNFHIPAEIEAALVGSTAVAAIGLVGFIARGLFPPPPKIE